jgi:hypothetical protein
MSAVIGIIIAVLTGIGLLFSMKQYSGSGGGSISAMYNVMKGGKKFKKLKR